MGQVAGRRVTSGGIGVASGTRHGRWLRRDPRAITSLTFAGFGLLYMVVNAVSLIDQRRALGRPIAAWQAWVLEGTSFAAWLMLLPVVLMLAIRLAPRPLWQATLGHVVGCVAVSVAHTLLMAALRIVAFDISGLDYAPSETLTARLLFEARKDVITYISILAVFLLARRLMAETGPLPIRPSAEAALIEVRDGSRMVMLRPDEIDWVNAAGNYVELHGDFGTELARRTMAGIEAELAHYGFVRVHRSRLVRRAAIASTETRQSGDFDITLRSGAVISGSRRFRQNIT
ncbi:LytTR family DNA-binding domain-containing protein [Blastomonas fulva]|uniref:LytTR family DNA-binding domain-containing protein n=1 Tax=Blastomonas fulva TaxID=1550728 RepID=UPI0013C2E30D|nr:LytTR family DNA-binding domain-containing protein [Blastomonas fulva]MDK2755205.1 LytTR family transcriptional regulator [Blastomonas fulva]